MSDNIQEAEVGSGTKISDTKQSEKRAQLTLKSIQLRLKQEKERAALQQQKKSIRVKEDIEESFSPSQIAALKAEYSKINGIDPDSDTYKKLIAMLDRLDLKSLQSLAGAEIKFVSKLAQNRVLRKSMKKEDVQLDEKWSRKYKDTIDCSNPKGFSQKAHCAGKKKQNEEFQLDELSTNKLADYKKKAGENASAADKAGDTKTGNKRFSGIMKATRKQFDNDAKKTNEELDIELDEVLSKDATAGDFIHDFVNSDNPKFAGKSKEKRKQMALAAYYAKQKNEELSPKQKALDKNKNGKIDGSDLAKLRGEELSPKQKELDKNKNGKIDGDDFAKLRAKKESVMSDNMKGKQKPYVSSDGKGNYKVLGNTGQTEATFSRKEFGTNAQAKAREHLKSMYDIYMKEEVELDESNLNEKSDYEVYHKDYSTAVQTAIKQAEKRGYEVDMDDWHDKVATGPKKPSSGKTNSFSINLMKDGKPSKKKLQMQVYNMDNHKYELNMYIEEVEIAEAGPGLWANIHAKRERIKNGSNERMRKPGEKGAPESGALDRARGKNEAASPAQQAAIAIAMKKDGKKPKDMAEENARVPRKPGQPANSKAHSDLYTDENPKDTIQGLKFATVEDAESSVSKIRNSDRTSAHKVQAAVAMEQRAKAAGKDSAAAVYRTYINSVSKKETYEGVVDKIKAIKRGMQAKAKADDHFDKAGDPKNANASKDLKKAVRYHNLLNKEETGEKMNAVTKHVTKGELTKSGVSKWLAEPLKKEEAVPEFKLGGPELAKKFNKAFKSMGVDAKVKIKTVSNISTNEEVVTEAKKKSFKDVKKKMKEKEMPSKATVKKGDMLTGKIEPIEINPELKEPAR
jgi:hypothetical protein